MRYLDIIQKPENYIDYGASVSNNKTEIPKSIESYNKSHFLQKVFATERTKIKQEKLTEEEKLQRVKNFVIHTFLFHFNYFKKTSHNGIMDFIDTF